MPNMNLQAPIIDTSQRYWSEDPYILKYWLNNNLQGVSWITPGGTEVKVTAILKRQVGSYINYYPMVGTKLLEKEDYYSYSIHSLPSDKILELSIAAIDDSAQLDTTDTPQISPKWINENKDHLSQWSNILKLQPMTIEPSIISIKLGDTDIYPISQSVAAIRRSKINNSCIAVEFLDGGMNFKNASLTIREKNGNIIEEQYNLLASDNKIIYDLKSYYPLDGTSIEYLVDVNIYFDLGSISAQGSFIPQNINPLDIELLPELQLKKNMLNIMCSSKVNNPYNWFIVGCYRGKKEVLCSKENALSINYLTYLISKYSSFDIICINTPSNLAQLEQISSKIVINTVLLEDLLLTSPSGQTLVVKYNPEVSGLKRVLQEQIVATLGSSYPIIRRNGQQNYRQFNISGLISYHSEDNNSDFIKLDIDNAIFATNMDKEIYIERFFREEVLYFLYENDVKLLSSSTEGDILVKLTSVSLTPNKQLGRRIYSFTAQATEVGDSDIQTLQKYGFKTQ